MSEPKDFLNSPDSTHLGLRPKAGEMLLVVDTHTAFASPIMAVVMEASTRFLVVQLESPGPVQDSMPTLFVYDHESDTWFSSTTTRLRLQSRPGHKVTTKALIQEKERLHYAVDLVLNFCDAVETKAAADAVMEIASARLQANNTTGATQASFDALMRVNKLLAGKLRCAHARQQAVAAAAGGG